jgi:hypothetical protein
MTKKTDPKDKKPKDDTYAMILAMLRKREKEENEARERYQALAHDPIWNTCTEEYIKSKMKSIVEISTLKKIA